MKIVIGLGNPGEQYKNTRHNAGVDLVDAIYKSQITNYKDGYGWRRKKDIFVAEFPDVVLVKGANVFMNESGKIIHELKNMNYFQNAPGLLATPSLTKVGEKENLLFVAHDDLDIKLGEAKIHLGKGPKEHHGVQSIEGALGTKDFWRIRIGIDNRTVPVAGEEYVLQSFTDEERKVLDGVMCNIGHDIIGNQI